MAPKWIGLAVFLYVIGIIIGSISEGQNVFLWEENTTQIVQSATSLGTATSEESWGFFSFPAAVPGYFVAVWEIITLDFPVFDEGPWVVFRWVLLAPMAAVIVYGFVVSFFSLFRRTA